MQEGGEEREEEEGKIEIKRKKSKIKIREEDASRAVTHPSELI